MLHYAVLVCILCSVSGFNFKRPNPKCHIRDSKCIAQIAKGLLESTINGIEELDVTAMDPLHQELIEKHVPGSEFALINSTITGYKNTIANDVTIAKDEILSKDIFRFDLTIPHYEMTGNYKLNGKLNDIVLEGDGKFELEATDINTVVDTLKEVYEKDGKAYLKVSYIRSTAKPPKDVHVTHYNSGTKALPEPILKFLNENPQVPTTFWLDTVNAANMIKMFDGFNKILASVSLDELIVDYIRKF